MPCSMYNGSGGRPVLTPLVAKDRIITRFQPAFHGDATPYEHLNFHAKVQTACSQNKTGTVGLKICKAVLVGDVAVGKTCLVNRFCHNVFDREYKATIGVDFEVEKFSVLNVPFNLQVWDTAGQERFKSIAASYYRGANVVVVAFDLSDVDTLAHARRWKEDACASASEPTVFLIGTKKDIMSESAFLDVQSKAIEMAREMGAEFWAVSSLTGENVRDFFFRLVCLTFNRQVLDEVDTSGAATPKQIGTLKIDDPPPELYEKSSTKKPKCCA